MGNNRPILIFPEGTRQDIHSKANYKRGIVYLYKNLGIPCVPVALNSGKYWPRNTIKKNPGKITVEFLKSIEPGLDDGDFMIYLTLLQDYQHMQQVSDYLRMLQTKCML